MTRPKIKCVVWDLDRTVWSGVLLEGDALELRSGVRETMAALDARGILQSIASRNEHDPAWAQLKRFGLDHFFLHPQIGWGAKSESVRRIAEALNIGLDTFAFVDDEPFERDEVMATLPSVRAYDAAHAARLGAEPEFMPRVVTEDARRRREMYQADAVRKEAESAFKGPSDAFLASLGMVFTVAPAEEADLARVEELVARTNQLNTTGCVYSAEELAAFRVSPEHRLLVAELTDRYGRYGKIGVALLHCAPDTWTIKLLLMSCRVMSRGVGGAWITLLRREARDAQVRLRAEFRATDRNRMMYVTYKFAGFAEVSESAGLTVLENDLTGIPPLPSYLDVHATLGGRCHA